VLETVIPLEQRDKALPAMRGTSDAVRTAARYALLRYRTFNDAGNNTCHALAASPKGENGRGLNLHVNVQVRTTDNVEYSTLVCKLQAPRSGDIPECIPGDGATVYPDLYKELSNIPALVAVGQDHCFDNDLRKVLENVLADHAYDLGWKGIRLVLSDEAKAYAIAVEKALRRSLDTGTLSISCIALDMSEANREALASELAQEFTAQFEALTERCSYTTPNVPVITKEYEALRSKLHSAEDLLGVEVPCIAAFIDCEQALMALA